jgi:hypothetical protein
MGQFCNWQGNFTNGVSPPTEREIGKMESVGELIRFFFFPYQLANWQGFRSNQLQNGVG